MLNERYCSTSKEILWPPYGLNRVGLCPFGLEPPAGLEPATSNLWDCISSQIIGALPTELCRRTLYALSLFFRRSSVVTIQGKSQFLLPPTVAPCCLASRWSALHSACRAFLQVTLGIACAFGGNWTRNRRLKRALLCQLSYEGKGFTAFSSDKYLVTQHWAGQQSEQSVNQMVS